MKPLPILLTGIAALLAAGFGWQLGGGVPRERPSQLSHRAASAPNPSGPNFPPPTGVSITHQMQADLLLQVERMDAASLAAWAARLVYEPGARDVLSIVVERWAAFEPAAAYQFFRRWPVPGLSAAIFTHLAAADLGLAVTLGLREANRPDVAEDTYGPALAAIRESLSRLPQAEAMAILQRGGYGLAYSLTDQIARSDPNAAAAFIDRLPLGMSRGLLREVLLSSWQEQDPASAVKYAVQQKDLSHFVKEYVMEAWLERDPQSASAWVLASENWWLLGDRIDIVINSLAAQDLNQAQQTARSLNGRDRTKALAALAKRQATTSVTEALTMSSEIPESAIRRGTVANIVQRWAGSDLPAATAYVLKIPDPIYRADCQLAIANGLNDRDKQDALHWTQALPAEERHRLAWRVKKLDLYGDFLQWQIALLKLENITP